MKQRLSSRLPTHRAMIRQTVALAGLLSVPLGMAHAAGGIDVNSWLHLDHPAIQYAEAPADDPVARLGKRIARGEVKLDYDAARMGYLSSLLKQLGVNVDSQVLVFSK